jgi:hypothetical protein
MTLFNENQVSSLEDKLNNLLPETVEVIDIGFRTHGKLGYIAYLELDNGNRCTVEFSVWLLPDEVLDLSIYDVCGFFNSKVDQSIFVDEPNQVISDY